MTIRRFALEPGGPARLEISWKLGFRDLQVLLDGNEVLKVPSAAALGKGAELTFGDSSIVRIKPANTFWPEIVVSLNGHKLKRISKPWWRRG